MPYALTILIISVILMGACTQKEQARVDSNNNAPGGMVYIPAGSFTMGGKSEQADPDEFPRHDVTISAFYMDVTEVTNAQFKEFVDATDYVTVAEKDVDWEEIKSQLPAEIPKPPDSVLRAGSLVFRPTEGPVNLRDYSLWWNWTVGADWQHPEGPESSYENRLNYPVVHIAWEDAIAYSEWTGKRLPTEAEWEWASMGGLDDVK